MRWNGASTWARGVSRACAPVESSRTRAMARRYQVVPWIHSQSCNISGARFGMRTIWSDGAHPLRALEAGQTRALRQRAAGYARPVHCAVRRPVGRQCRLVGWRTGACGHRAREGTHREGNHSTDWQYAVPAAVGGLPTWRSAFRGRRAVMPV